MKKILFFLFFLAQAWPALADEYKVDGVYPSHWWVGMKNQQLQLMVRGANIQENSFSIAYPGVRLVKLHKPENRNYVFIDLVIGAAAKPGILNIVLRNPNGTGSVPFELKARRPGRGTSFAQGVRSIKT